MDRVFLDANVLFSAAYRPDSLVLRLWKLQDIALCTSHYAAEEARINLVHLEQRERLDDLIRSLSFFDVVQGKLPREISLPEKDVPILMSAIQARATHLLTGD